MLGKLLAAIAGFCAVVALSAVAMGLYLYLPRYVPHLPRLAAYDVEPKVRVVAQLPHADEVRAVAFSRDGRLALTGSRDKTVKVWDLATGTTLRSIRARGREVDAVAFSPDGRLALSAASPEISDRDDASLRLWEVATGRELRRFANKERSTAFAVAFSPDGRLALSAGTGGTVYLWDVDTGREVRRFEGHQDWVKAVAFSPDGRVALSAGSNDKTLRLWDVSTGRELRVWRDAHQMPAFAFSPDGRHFVASESLTPWDARLKVWETATGREAGAFAKLNSPDSLAFSPDGKFVVAGSGGHDIKVWDVTTRKEVRSLRPRDSVIEVAFSPDGRSILAGTRRGTLTLWDAASGKEIKTISAPARQVTATAFSPDGRFILSGGGRLVRLWEAATGKLLRTYVGLPDGPVLTKDSMTGENAIIGDGVSAVAFSADGRLALASLGGLGTLVRRWEVATGKEITALVRRMPHAVAFSPDGRFAYVGDSNVVRGDLRALDMEARKSIAFPGADKRIMGLAVSQDGRLLLSGGERLQLWDAASGKELAFGRQGEKEHKDLRERMIRRNLSESTTAVALSPDGRLALSASVDGNLDLWDAATGDLVRTLKGHKERLGEWVRTVTFSPDGRTVLSGDEGGLLKLWDVAAGKELKTLRGHVGRVGSVAFAPDGRRAVSGAEDGAVRIWDLEQGRELAAMFAAAEDDWLAITPHGFFSASHRDTGMLSLVSEAGVTTMGQVHQSLFNPDLVREALAGDSAKEVERAAKVVSLDQVVDSGPPPSVAIPAHPPGSRSATATVSVGARVTDRGKGIGRIEWRVNGITVGVMGAPPGAGAVHDVQRTLALDPGENRIEVIAYEARNVLASPAARTTIAYSGPADAVKPKLHILAVGINAYVDQGKGAEDRFPPLSLAVADAKAFAAEMRKAAAGLYSEVRVTEALDADAAAAGLDKAVDQVASHVNPRDTFVLYVAAHGVSRAGRFYLIPQDYQGGSDPEALAGRAVGQERLQDWVANRIKARKAVILLDTCESGALVSGYAKSRTDAPASEAAIGRLHEATGRPVLTAAASGKPAFEGYRGHGVFTYALIDALRRGDSNGNSLIELSEMVAHVQGLVPKLSAELDGRGISMVAMRGLKDDKQSAHFGSTGEDFALVRRLQ